jgi:hypothetical protein
MNDKMNDKMIELLLHGPWLEELSICFDYLFTLIRFIHLIMQEYDCKCLKMYLITLKVFKIC